ncbi:MAG: hypothetical protein ACPG77_13930, partial [Nannocystaceae bacterium]
MPSAIDRINKLDALEEATRRSLPAVPTEHKGARLGWIVFAAVGEIVWRDREGHQHRLNVDEA